MGCLREKCEARVRFHAWRGIRKGGRFHPMNETMQKKDKFSGGNGG